MDSVKKHSIVGLDCSLLLSLLRQERQPNVRLPSYRRPDTQRAFYDVAGCLSITICEMTFDCIRTLVSSTALLGFEFGPAGNSQSNAIRRVRVAQISAMTRRAGEICTNVHKSKSLRCHRIASVLGTGEMGVAMSAPV
jgi:hypothetical protein